MNMFKKETIITTNKRRKNRMSGEELSPQLQDQINRLQQARAQLQMISQQRQQVDLQIKETEEALKEIEAATEKTPIYKSIGALLIKTKGKSDIKKELTSAKESLEVRKTTLEKQEGRSREKLTELQSKVESSLKLASGAGNLNG
jgi:prefoldin beta subunit